MFVEDVDLAGQLGHCVVRSPHAHAASVERIDTNGVSGASVFAYHDIADRWTVAVATAVATVASDAGAAAPALANGRVRHVGDPVAFVVAESRVAARDAAECVVVEYRPRPSGVDAAVALVPGAPLLWDEVPGNLSFRFQTGDPAAVGVTALARRRHVWNST